MSFYKNPSIALNDSSKRFFPEVVQKEIMKNSSTWIKYTVLALAFFGALGYLFVSGMQSSMVYYLTLEELSATPPGTGEGVRLAGWVKEGSIVGSALDGEISFVITDGKRDMPVRYAGQIPDTFENGAEVIVEGVFRGQPVFEAATMLAKCPSKYEASATAPRGERPNQ
jgi:cytochrome c-type biogenesis protein CcmE